MISEFRHLLSTLSPDCDKRHNVAAMQPSAQAAGLLTSAVPSSLVSQGLQPEKCYDCRVWKTFVPQTSSRDSRQEGRRLSDKSGSSVQSSRQDTQRWGGEENKMWMGRVKGI